MRKMLFALVVLALAVPALADDGPLAQRAKGEVVGFLALTPGQVGQWDALLATRQQTVPPLRTQLQGIEDQLKALLGQSNPDPTAVGNLVLQAHGVRDQIKAAESAYVDGFGAMLATDQQAKFAFLHRAEKAAPLIPAFRLFALLPPPPHPRLP
ncbi:MAG TPA: periplasmic heavy metal sensor [Thermoanaerobaculaceae bacterium]|nr:periplasmic heavy metal sensor [Thermoanaerobaculaceae bacterium]